MKKRVLSVLLAMTLMLSLLPAVTPHAHAEGHTCVDNNFNHHCDICREYIACYDSDVDVDDRCDLCGACMNPEDSDGDNKCDHCTSCVSHSFENCDWYVEEGYHYPECDRCSYYNYAQGAACADENNDQLCDVCGNCKDGGHSFVRDEEDRDSESHRLECSICGADGGWESHFDSEEDGVCDVCDTCMEHDETTAYVWDEQTWDNVDHWVVCKDCGMGYGWENHSDGEDEDALCDVCNFNIACSHDYTEMEYDGDGHWDVCTDCGQIVFIKRAHSFDGQCYHVEDDQHYPECDGCEYYLAGEGEAHADEDHDEVCDACGYWIHEHTYEDGYFTTENGKHYPECDQCSYYDETAGEECTDNSVNHGCDVCGTHMEWLCGDTNNDHICDVCTSEMTDLCTDTDDDHICDAEACARDMKELCSSSTEGDWICETCGRNFCNHYFPHEPISNGDGTHTGTCDNCGEVTEDCYAWHYDASLDTETTHTAFCRCGYRLPTETHTYHWSARSVTSHLVSCEDCGYEKSEAHTTQNGICDVCEMQVTTYDDVYVGGVGLKDGQYLDNSGNVTETKPAGGYAYYKDGVLELNDYAYAGHGVPWTEYEYGEVDGAALYATKDLILVLKGENSLQTTRPDTVAEIYNYGDGIATEKNLTIRGDGSLTIQVEDDGTDMESGDMVIEGGTLIIDSGDHGLDVNGSVTVTGGTVDVTAGDDGFNVNEDITISGGTITVDAEDNGLDCVDGGVTISGGSVDITTRDKAGIEASEDVIISGGVITIRAEEFGINGYEGVFVSGGELVATSRRTATVSSRDITITGGNLELTAGVDVVILATESMTIENDALPEGVGVERDEDGNFLILLDPGTPLVIAAPFSAELKEDGIHLTNSPWGMKVIIAAYNENGKMIDIQVVENPGDVVKPTVTGAMVKAFFLNGRSVPARTGLPID